VRELTPKYPVLLSGKAGSLKSERSALLTPGEAVLPKGLVDRLSTDGSGPQASNHYHAHLSVTNHVQTIDGDGMQDALDKHADKLQATMENTLRRMNR
jgi:hypothetical protein